MGESSYDCTVHGELRGDGTELTHVPGVGWLHELRAQYQQPQSLS